MSVLSIGNDICSVQRIEDLVLRFSIKFINKILTIHEIQYFHQKYDVDLLEFLRINIHNQGIENHNKIKDKIIFKKIITFVASNFAIKESFIKCIGSRNFIEPIFSMKNDISVIRNALGKPFIHLSDRVNDYIKCFYGACDIHITNSHDIGCCNGSFVSAFIVISRKS